MPKSRVGFQSGRHMRGSLLMAVGRGIGLVAGMLIQLILVRVLSPRTTATWLGPCYRLDRDCVRRLRDGLSDLSVIHDLRRGARRLQLAWRPYPDDHDPDRGSGLTLLAAAAWCCPHRVAVARHSSSGQAAAILPIVLLIAPLAAVDMITADLFASFGEATTVFFCKYILGPMCLRLGAVVLVYVLAGGVAQLAVALVAAAAVGVLIYGQLAWRLLIKDDLWVSLRAYR